MLEPFRISTYYFCKPMNDLLPFPGNMASDDVNAIIDKDFTKTMKMAIALACIRNKPEDMTAGEYTEQLCQNYLKKQLVCQENLKSAENEILRLRQQLVVQSTHGPNISEPSFNLVEEQSYLTSASSGVNFQTTAQTSLADSSHLIQHTAFLQSILNLQTVTKTHQLTTVTYTTIKNSLTMIKNYIDNDANFPISSIQKNVHVFMTILDSERIVDLVQVVDGVLDIVTSILDILAKNEHQTVEQTECLLALVTSFCHDKLFEKIVKMTLTVIEDFSSHLRNVKERKDKIDIIKYWNLYSIFRILENVIYKHRHHTSMVSSDFVNMINEKLDKILLHLTDPYPLFAHAVWKLQGILNQFVSIKQ